MNNESKPLSEDLVFEPIVREIGERVVIINGRDYIQPDVRVVPNTHRDAGDNEKAIYISQAKAGGGVSISLATLQAIIDWAQGIK